MPDRIVIPPPYRGPVVRGTWPHDPFSEPPPTSARCVYTLLRDGKVVYVGMTYHIRQRLREHFKSSKRWDSWAFKTVDVRHQRRIEARLIRHFDPEYNLAGRDTYL